MFRNPDKKIDKNVQDIREFTMKIFRDQHEYNMKIIGVVQVVTTELQKALKRITVLEKGLKGSINETYS